MTAQLAFASQPIDPDDKQRLAADPRASVWVGASAGTGKTKVLTDRVLRLLLEGAAPERILCLTFTRAAAGEMANRVQKKLSTWATLPPAQLHERLATLLGYPAPDKTFKRARALFTQLLDTPGGLNIMTIHGFCQSLLRRFPLEAQVPVHFKVMEEKDAQDLLDRAVQDVLCRSDDPSLKEGLSELSEVFDFRTFKGMLPTLYREFDEAFSEAALPYETLKQSIRTALNLPQELRHHTPTSYLKKVTADFPQAALKHAAEILQTGKPTDQKKAEAIFAWLQKGQDFSAYQAIFLTKERLPRARLVTKELSEKHPTVQTFLMEEAERLQDIFQNLNLLKVCTLSQMTLWLGKEIRRRLSTLKNQKALMDYDDLIRHAARLLKLPDVAPWVLFKLDGGLDHILIDEAQDTNPQQWEVIRALAEEFFAGTSQIQSPRTLFVVGDAKQSIYSFQGADPKAFDTMRTHFSKSVEGAQQTWRRVNLDLSFRSTPEVLSAVDAIFKTGAAREGVLLPDDTLHHQSYRHQAPGHVELWPLVDPQEDLPIPPWTPPIETQAMLPTPSQQVANALADRIKRWITHKEILPSQNRPIQASDIMILVQRRSPFVDELIRALKQRALPVAGSDRLIVTEHIAVMDLIALAQFLLLPEDDLTLATVLKSPLFGFSEEDLFTLAHGRGPNSLWQRLKVSRDNPFIHEAYQQLKSLLARVDFCAPHTLFSEILSAQGGRGKLLARLGKDALDPLDEFLSMALAYQQTHTPSLQGFLAWLKSGKAEIKRDLEQTARNEIRIMTVHGAKGLQAPIVILPDTVRIPTHKERFAKASLPGGNPLPIWLPPQAEQTPQTNTLAQKIQEKTQEEYHRLLYVALTRAEDQLYICGWGSSRDPHPECWYHLIRRGLQSLTAPVEMTIGEALSWTGDGFILTASSTPTGLWEKPASKQPKTSPTVPEWARKNVAEKTKKRPPLVPSRPEEEPAERSPRLTRPTLSSGHAAKRGIMIHTLLEHVPGLPADQQEQMCEKILTLRFPKMPQENRQEMISHVMTILKDPNLSPLFGSDSRAEVSLIGTLKGRTISGRIDRLVVTQDQVMVIDYKTHQTPPKTLEEVPMVYLQQMNAYKSILKDIYPHHKIVCALLWTESLTLMRLPSEALETIPQ